MYSEFTRVVKMKTDNSSKMSKNGCNETPIVERVTKGKMSK